MRVFKPFCEKNWHERERANLFPPLGLRRLAALFCSNLDTGTFKILIFSDPSSKSSACGMVARQDTQSLYRMFLTQSVRNSESGKQLTDENYSNVNEVKSMLGMTNEDEATQFRMNFEHLNSIMAMFEMTGDDFTPDLVTNLKQMVDKNCQ